MTTIPSACYTPTSPALGLDAHEHPQCYCNWAVAHTVPQREAYASDNLARQGFINFLPTFARRRYGSPRIIPTPLFSGYVFVNHEPNTSWRPIRETPGIQSLLKCGDKLQYARAGAVEALQATEHLRAIPLPPHSLWRLGDACRLAHGPFQRLHAVVAALDGEIATVTILMLGELRDIRIEINNLARA